MLFRSHEQGPHAARRDRDHRRDRRGVRGVRPVKNLPADFCLGIKRTVTEIAIRLFVGIFGSVITGSIALTGFYIKGWNLTYPGVVSLYAFTFFLFLIGSA